MRVARSLMIFAAAAVISGCVDNGVAYDLIQLTNYDSPCRAESPKHLKGANWSKAKTVDVEIRGGQFTGYGVDLRVGQPTVLRLTNRDDAQRGFDDGEFMRAVALESVSLGGRGLSRPCISGIWLDPGASAEMRLVPVKAGTYYPEDSIASYIGPTELFSRGGLGVITINR